MRLVVLIFVLSMSFGFRTCSRTQTSAPLSTRVNTTTPERENPTTPKMTTKVDWATQVKPIFEARCQNCHFPGGAVYQRLPFDREATITKLGTKLFTRLKDEDERRVIRKFLAQQSVPVTP